MADDIKLDLDPKKVLDSMNDLKEGVKQLAEKMEAALGKDVPKSIGKTEEAAEKGTNKISSYFRNLGTRVKEDLKTAFATTEVMGGMKFAKDMGEGIKQVFNMERAFDKLNTRLGLTSRQMLEFKKTMGQRISATGQKLEDVLPGVETASSKGGVKSPAQLANIGEALGQVKATTGENVEGVSDTVVEILKSQGQKITDDSFKKTLDAIQSTRVTGSFKSANEAGGAIEQLSPYAQKLGLNTRELGGLAATASRSGSAGQDILKQLMEKGTTIGGQQQINSALGSQIFKNGKLDAKALGGVDTERFGKYSQQTLSQATGLEGANGADLKRFVEAFKGGMGDFNKVVSGADETASQFTTATDNLASRIDEFKEKAKEVGLELGSAISKMAKDLMKGQAKEAISDLKNFGKTAWENKGTIAASVGTTALIGSLAGGGMRTLLNKVGGGMLGGAAGAAAAEAAGIQKVYVVNMSDAAGLSGAASGAAGALGKFGKAAGSGLAVAGVGIAAYEAASYAVSKSQTLNGGIGEKLYDIFHPDEIKAAVAQGTAEGNQKSKGAQKPTYTNPSDVKGRGGNM